jgi:hypothetical protein
MNTARDSDIRAAIAAKETADTRIAQKVMAAHREAFHERFPGQIEHCLRLTAERLQACLNKPEHCVLMNPQTWPATPDDILGLARALESLHVIHRHLQVTTPDA